MPYDGVQLDPTQYGGATIKAIYRRAADGQVYNPAINAGAGGFEVWADSHYGQYLLATNQQGSSGLFGLVRPDLVVAANAVSLTLIKIVDSSFVNDKVVAYGSESVANSSGGVKSISVTEHSYSVSPQ